MVDRKIKLELDTSFLRNETAKTEVISDSGSKSSLMIQGLPKTRKKFEIPQQLFETPKCMQSDKHLEKYEQSH